MHDFVALRFCSLLISLSHRLIGGLPLPGEDPRALATGEQQVLARVDSRVGRVVGAQLQREADYCRIN